MYRLLCGTFRTLSLAQVAFKKLGDGVMDEGSRRLLFELEEAAQEEKVTCFAIYGPSP